MVDPTQHKTQYQKLLGPPEDALPVPERKDDDDDIVKYVVEIMHDTVDNIILLSILVEVQM